MKKTNRHSAYYAYMAPFLETGHANVIAEAKKHWRRTYKANWRKEKRKKEKEVTLSWTKDEFKTLKEEAKRHSQKPTRFIKQATLAYISKRYVVPNQREINKLLQLVAMTYNAIEAIVEDEEHYTTGVKRMQEELFILEHEIRVTLLSPKTIEQIIEQEIQKDPEAGTYLFRLLERMQYGH